jgi:hypothetical protein
LVQLVAGEIISTMSFSFKKGTYFIGLSFTINFLQC